MLFTNTANCQDYRESSFHIHDFRFIFNGPFKNIKSKFHVSLAYWFLHAKFLLSAGELFNLNAHCEMMLFLSNKKSTYLMGHCPVNIKYGALME